MTTFICYERCSTCQKAQKWLDEQGAVYTPRPIKEQNPTAAELESWLAQSGLPVKRFVNTSGLLYKSMGLKDKLPAMSDGEVCALLATDGMLVKRPILLTDKGVCPGFKPEVWTQLL
ncbi:MAG TPA: arsenate reductase family protein [Candidatus Fournierella merdigallinarum]|nr:arsenate reductase family protein [Candidatus Fournierella merdigallinarum]